MLLSADTVQYVAIAGVAVGIVGLGTAAAVGARLRRVRRAYSGVAEAAESGRLLEQIASQQDEIDALRGGLSTVSVGLDNARAELADAIRHVAVVRYDAFEDMGGRMSFSAALLDDAGDGITLTSINGRTETRSYAKGVKTGTSDSPLSPEEQQAIGFALRGTAVGEARLRRRQSSAPDQPVA
ncbi:MAG TPA: DUF4446 family protein [Mycobacteriales bacterium]